MSWKEGIVSLRKCDEYLLRCLRGKSWRMSRPTNCDEQDNDVQSERERGERFGRD